MKPISYDPDKAPELSKETLRAGLQKGLFPAQVFCAPSLDLLATEGVIFWVFVKFLPRIREVIELEDGKRCRVLAIQHSIEKQDQGVLSLTPILFAIPDDDSETDEEETEPPVS